VALPESAFDTPLTFLNEDKRSGDTDSDGGPGAHEQETQTPEEQKSPRGSDATSADRPSMRRPTPRTQHRQGWTSWLGIFNEQKKSHKKWERILLEIEEEKEGA